MSSKRNTFNFKKYLPYLSLLACLLSANLLLAVNSTTAKPFPNQDQKEGMQDVGKKSRYNFSLFQFMSLELSNHKKTSAINRNTLNHRKDSLFLSDFDKKD